MNSLVYDAYPDTAYDPLTGLRPHSTIDWARPHRLNSSAQDFAARDNKSKPQGAFRTRGSSPQVQGFGNVVARRMLASGPPPKHPWLTVDLAERELAIMEYQRDRTAGFLDTVA